MRRGRTVAHILSGDLWAGAEAQVYHLVRELNERGKYEARVLLLNEGAPAEKFRAAGVDVRVVSETDHGHFSLLNSCASLLREWRPVILHSHGYKENLLAGLVSLRLHSCAAVRTQHGSPFPVGTFPYTLYYRIDRSLARFLSTSLIAVSGAVADEAKRFLPGKMITTIRNGISLPLVSGEPEDHPVPFPPGSRVVVSCGRLSREKRYDILIDALRIVARSHPEVRLLLIGDGPEREFLESLVAEKAKGLVHFAGFQEETAGWMSMAEIYALSSDREGLPMSVLEALALGLPVVATCVGGVPELLEGGKGGLLVPPGNQAALAGALEDLLNNADLRRRYSLYGPERIRKDYSMARVAEETENVYARVEKIR